MQRFTLVIAGLTQWGPPSLTPPASTFWLFRHLRFFESQQSQKARGTPNDEPLIRLILLALRLLRFGAAKISATFVAFSGWHGSPRHLVAWRYV